ncbi:MAG: hypothetical protein HYZ30_00910 [Candidatus Azosocius agrarius]|nr:MAG: hypothetical protein HYZ30_00910 [Gammaproteobacteria bacterium]
MVFNLACPLCYSKLFYNKTNDTFVCLTDNIIYDVVDGVPKVLMPLF